MYKELREKAEKKVEAKKAFYICTIVFAFVSIVLLMLAYYIPAISFWVSLPIPIFVMILSILYLSAFGLPTRNGQFSDDWEEEEIEKEMLKLYRRRKADLPPLEDLSETEVLELKELERLKKKWDWREDYV